MNREIELKPATKQDAKRVFDAWGYNQVNFHYLSAPSQSSIENAQSYLDRVLENPADPAFHIALGSSGETVGFIKAKLEGHRAIAGC